MKRSFVWKSGWCIVATLAAVWSPGCSRSPNPTNGHAHEPETSRGGPEAVRSAQINVFGDRYEVFVEHPPVISGAPTRFVTHVTDLKTLEPRREGPVRLRLRRGQAAPIEQVEQAPARPGIYEPSLTFPEAGDWAVALVVPDGEGDQTLAFPPVTVFGDAGAAERAHVPEAPEGITFLKEQQWRVRAGTEIAAHRRLVEHLRLPASVAARPGTRAQVTPPIAGRLLPPPGGSLPVIGDTVEAGQVLALLAPSFSEAGARFVETEADVVRARLALDQAQAALDRIETLAKAEAKSKRELEEAAFARKAAQARYDAALVLQRSYQQAGGTAETPGGTAGPPAVALRAPIAGTIIAQSGTAAGEHVSPDQAMYTVLDAATVFIEARIPERSIGQLGDSTSAAYELPGDTGPRTPITGNGSGRRVFLGLQVDPATRTVPLVYEAHNAGLRLRVGQSLNLYVETGRAEHAIAIPHEAVVDEGGRPIAFVQVGGETFEKRDLTLGIRDGDWVQVLAGVEEGERVVSQGAYAVRLASVSSSIPAHGHAH